MQKEIQKIESLVKRLFDEADIRYCGEKYFFNNHIDKVKKIALELTKNQKVDKQVILLSCILHDIGYIYNPNNHTDPSYAKKIMKEFCIDDNTIKKVCYCISNHEECTGNIIEARILQVADKLSHLEIGFLKMMKKIKGDYFINWLNTKLEKLELCLKKNIEIL